MNTQNISTLKIHKLTQAQYERELAAGRIDENAIYLTPDEEVDLIDTNTTYDLAASKSSTNGNVKMNLTAGGSGSGTDSITIKGTGAATVTTDANGVITINSTDTTYTLSSFGINATAVELNYTDGVTSNI